MFFRTTSVDVRCTDAAGTPQPDGTSMHHPAAERTSMRVSPLTWPTPCASGVADQNVGNMLFSWSTDARRPY